MLHGLTWVFLAILVAFPTADGGAMKPEPKNGGGNVNVGGELPFDEINIFGDFGRIFWIAKYRGK